MVDKLAQQLEFLQTIDALKGVHRSSPILDRARRENSGEHSWNLAMYALVLAEHAPSHVDIGRVIQMRLLRDIVEIDAGEMPLYGGTSDVASAHVVTYALLPSWSTTS